MPVTHGVTGSSPVRTALAKIAQLVEHDLAKVGVAGSSPVFRSKFPSPDGGIGRRAGLKHQWSNPSRFDPGSGYFMYRGGGEIGRHATLRG